MKYPLCIYCCDNEKMDLYYDESDIAEFAPKTFGHKDKVFRRSN